MSEAIKGPSSLPREGQEFAYTDFFESEVHNSFWDVKLVQPRRRRIRMIKEGSRTRKSEGQPEGVCHQSSRKVNF